MSLQSSDLPNTLPNTPTSSGEVTRLLTLIREGNRLAEEQLFEVLYQDLHRLAAKFLQSEVKGQTLSPTALVNETYLRIFGSAPPLIKDRHHFFALSCQVMRRLLVDRARGRASLKRYGGKREELTDVFKASEESPDQIIAVDRALTRLSTFAPRAAKIVEMRFFGGMEVSEIAQALDTSERTVRRDWSMSKAWLFKELESSSPEPN